MSEWHTAFAPATVANVGPGFDVLGFALDPALGLGDTCAIRLRTSGSVDLSIDGDGGRLPLEPALNVATVAAQAVLDRAGFAAGFEMRLTKGLPPGSGLGSSAASAASAALAMNQALGEPFVIEQLFDAGRAGEAVAAGAPHPDNVVPALAGGFRLMVDHGGVLEVVGLPVPAALRVAVVIPDLEVRTAEARSVLPPTVQRADAVFNLGRLGLLVSALHDGDLERLARAIEDRLHQPWRTSLTPGFDQARTCALAAGALGVGLSGSGPAMFAFADSDRVAHACGEALAGAFRAQGTAATFAAGRLAAQRVVT